MSELEAAVAETEDRRPSMEVGGQTVRFPAKLPPGMAAAVQMQRLDLVYKILSGGDEKLLDHLIVHLSEDDFDEVAKLYGLTVPNSPSSAG